MKVAVEGAESAPKKNLQLQKVDSFEDLLKQTQKDANAAATPATVRAKKKKKKAPHASTFEHEDENLGDDFEATPWLPPSIEKAAEFKNNAIFRNGDVRLDSINVIQAPDLGNGVTLYFQFAMTMALTLADARPLETTEFNQDGMLVGTWVAECIIHKSIGAFISAFKDKQHVMEKLYRCRAQMKMYAENSCHAAGHNLPRFLRAEQAMIHTGTVIDKLTEENLKKHGLKILEEHDIETGQVVMSPKSGKNSAGSKIISVTKAPEPDQIVWENLEVSNQQKWYLRTRTALITTGLVILCFVIILQASIYKNRFSAKIPKSDVCKKTVPELFNSDVTLYNKIPVSKYALVRPPTLQASTLDQQCSDKLSHTFFAVYSETNDWTEAGRVVDYDINACTNTTMLCPAIGRKTYCPYALCSFFPAFDVGSCYCYSQLSTILNTLGVVGALNKLATQAHSGDPPNLSLSIIITTVVNTLLRIFLKKLALQEAHASVDKEQGSIMSKIFISNFATMALIVLI
eukprot:gene32925-40642_t